MKIQVQAKFQVNDQLQALIEEKVNKLGTFYDRVTSATVFLREEENRHQQARSKTVEIRFYVPEHTLFSEYSSESFEKALAEATENMRRQLKKYKEQLNGF